MKKLLGTWLVAVGGFLSSTAADLPDVFWWGHVSEQKYYSYSDPNNWTYGTEDAHTTIPAAAPGANDWIAYLPHWAGSPNSYGYWYFDLDGNSVTTKGIWEGEKVYYPYRTLFVKNGTLTFTESFTTRRHTIATSTDAKIVFAPTSLLDIRWGGADNKFETRVAGSEMEFLGEVRVDSTPRFLTYVNTTMTINPTKFWFYTGFANSSPYAYIENRGTMNFPNGLAMESSDKRATGGDFRFIQTSGTMTISGPITYTGKALDTFSFALNGGLLKIEDNVSMAFMNTVGMPNANATATIDIAEDKTLDWSNATFAEGTTLKVTGAGTILLGASLPAHLQLDPTVKVGLTRSLTIPAGVITGYGASTFGIELLSRDTIVIVTDDATVKALLDEAVDAPPGWTLTSTDTSIMLQAEGKIFWWNDPTAEKGVLAFDDPANWSYMTEDGVGDVATEFPGDQDFLAYIYRTGYYTGYNRFNLGGRTIRMKGYDYSYAAKHDDIKWPDSRELTIRNGSFEFTDSFKTRAHKVYTYAGAKFIFGRTCKTDFEWNGAINYVETKEAGAEIDIYGNINLASVRFKNVANAVMIFDPETFAFTEQCYETAPYGGIYNAGTMSFPRGLAFDGTEKHKVLGHDFRFEQVDGTMTFGGPLTATANAKENYTFDLRGGTLALEDDVLFDIFVTSGMLTEQKTATVKVAEGKTFTWLNASAAAGTTLVVTGPGTFALGATAPAETLALGEGASLCFVELGTTLPALTGVETANFAFEGSLRNLDRLMTGTDAETLAAIAAKLTMPEGFTASVENGWIVARVALPEPSEEDGIFSGAETEVEITSDYAKDKIVLMNGATAVIKGTVSLLPPVTLYYGATLRFAADAVAPMPQITAYCDLTHLPVVEIAKGAVVTTAVGYKLKNVRLNWYGEIKTSGATTFGTADAGETTMFALTADDGAKLNAPHNQVISFVNPTTGGRVMSPEGLVFRKMKYLPEYSNYFRFEIGRDNPTDEVFDFTLDGTYLDLRGNSTMYFGGAAHIKCVNGGGFYKHDAWRSWGLYGGLVFQQNATLELDSKSYFYYHYNQVQKVQFNPSTPDAEQLVLKNGSWFEVHVPNGMNCAAVRVEDSFVNVRALQEDANHAGRTDWYWDIFHNFTRIHVPEGKFFGVRPVVSSYGIEWDRTLAIGAPVTGGGSLLVTNDTEALTVRAIVKLGTNTATGEARATAGACETKLVFADGANWAGTLVANDCIGFTNLTAAASPATVTVNNIRFEGNLPIRVWKGGVNAADQLVINGSLAKTRGGFAPVEVNGAPFAVGDTFTVGTIPAANLPAKYERAFTSPKWKLVAEGDGDTKTLKLVYEPLGGWFILM